MKPNHFTILSLCVILLTIGQTLSLGTLSPLASARPQVVQDEQSQKKWRKDLKALVKGLRKRHPNPFHGIPEAEFMAAVAGLDARIPTLTDSQITREFIGLVALISRNGRDGHTEYVPSTMHIHLLPLQFYTFSDGLFIIDAREPYSELIGRQVIAIGDHSIEDVAETLTPYIAKDNDATVRWHMPTLLIVPEFLESFGFITDERVQLRLQDQSGEQETFVISSVTIPEYMAWREFPAIKLPQTHDELYLSDSYNPFWFTLLEDSSLLYVRYNQIARKNDENVKLALLVKRIKQVLSAGVVQRLVIDLRQNNGGDSNTYGPLLAAIRENATINQQGKLFAIINQGVFSAASNFVTDLERQTNVLFVGEQTGGSPNHYGDSVQVKLPNFGGTLFVSTVYHERSDASDPRLSVEPDIAVELSSSDYFAGRDAAMEAIRNFTAQQSTN